MIQRKLLFTGQESLVSMGTKSPLYRPIERDVVGYTETRSSDTLRPHIGSLYDILTDHCRIESLLWFSVVKLLDRALCGERDAGVPGGDLAPLLLLSAVRKDRRGKHQTAAMKLIHDVVVELGMAEENFERLQGYLAEHLSLRIVGRHSCDKAPVALDRVEEFRRAVREDQLLRTSLDWSAETTIVDEVTLLATCTYPMSQHLLVRTIMRETTAYVASAHEQAVA